MVSSIGPGQSPYYEPPNENPGLSPRQKLLLSQIKTAVETGFNAEVNVLIPLLKATPPQLSKKVLQQLDQVETQSNLGHRVDALHILNQIEEGTPS